MVKRLNYLQHFTPFIFYSSHFQLKISHLHYFRHFFNYFFLSLFFSFLFDFRKFGFFFFYYPVLFFGINQKFHHCQLQWQLFQISILLQFSRCYQQIQPPNQVLSLPPFSSYPQTPIRQ